MSIQKRLTYKLT